MFLVAACVHECWDDCKLPEYEISHTEYDRMIHLLTQIFVYRITQEALRSVLSIIGGGEIQCETFGERASQTRYTQSNSSKQEK